MNYHDIKEEAKSQRCKVTDLLALAPQNDPFYVGRKSQLEGARWFADIWNRFGYDTGVHLRRIHYRLVSQEPKVRKPDGDEYLNMMKDWQYLTNTAKWARYLGLVDAEAFVDRRNKDPIKEFARFTNPGDYEYKDPTPRYSASSGTWYWNRLPGLPRLRDLEELPTAPYYNVEGYTPQQEYLVEVWCEKTTMDDELIPVCEEMGMNLVRGPGELSITLVYEFMRRLEASQRDGRILYISDYDPAGVGMPRSVARKIEFLHYDEANFRGLDIRLDPIALTAEQVWGYNLPRTPVKDSDRRKARWIEEHGKGQVELDALEALYPGSLAEIVRQAAGQYIDVGLQDNANEARRDLGEVLDRRLVEIFEEEDIGEWFRHLGVAHSKLSERWGDLQQDIDHALEPFQERIEEYRDEFDSIHEFGRAIYEELARRMENETDIDAEHDYPCPEADLPREMDVQLFNSERDYFTQLECYAEYCSNGRL